MYTWITNTGSTLFPDKVGLFAIPAPYTEDNVIRGTDINSVRDFLYGLRRHTAYYRDLRDFDCVCDGVVDDTSNLSAVIAAIGSTPLTLIVSGPTLISVPMTIPSTAKVRFEADGAFVGAGLVTFTPWANAIDLSSYETTAHASSTYVPLAQRGAASGVATLDSGTKIPSAQIPDLSASYDTAGAAAAAAAASVPLAQKGAASGVCPLDASLHVPAANLVAANMPDLSAIYTTKAREGAASGVATLDANTKIPSAQIPAQPYDVVLYYPGKPGDAAIVAKVVLPRAVTFAAAFSGSYGDIGTAATATTTLTVAFYRGGVSQASGTIQIATNGVYTFALASQYVSAAGDVLKVTNQATADATAADISVTLTGTR